MKGIGFLVVALSAALGISLVYAGFGIALHGAPYASVLVPLTTWGLPIAVIIAAAFVMALPSLRTIAALNVLAIIAIGGAVLWPVYALAQDASGTTINAGGIFSDMRGTIEAGAAIVVAGIVGWIGAVVKKNTGLSIDGKMRDTLQSAAMNAVHYGLDHVQSTADKTDIDVKSQVLAQGIEYLRKYAPAAIKHFNLSGDDLLALLRAKLAQLQPAEVTAVSKVTTGA